MIIINYHYDQEFVSACCKRNTIENPFFPKANPLLGAQAGQVFRCRCSTNRSPTYIDPFGRHLVGCKVDAHAIRLHDNVNHKLVVLLRSLTISLEPIGLFADLFADDNRRPDILIRNPYGGGSQILVDVAVTGVNGQSRRSDQDADQPLQYRFNQVAEEHDFSFIPAIFLTQVRCIKRLWI